VVALQFIKFIQTRTFKSRTFYFKKRIEERFDREIILKLEDCTNTKAFKAAIDY
jgi:hypothetical protein